LAKETNKKEIRLTPFEQELVETMKKVKSFKLAAEANIVSIIYAFPDTLHNFELKLSDFSNNIWRVYFNIANDVIIKEKKQVLDDVTVGLYLEKHPKLKEKFDEYGGYTTIENAKEYVKEKNLQGYVSELQKWNVVIQLIKMKFPVQERLSDFADMSAEDIYNEYEAVLNHIFVNLDRDVKSYNLLEGMHSLLDRLNEGETVGLPLYNSPMLNKIIGGSLIGNITMLGALSGAGKTTLSIQWVLPQIIEKNEKICILINEEDADKWRRELIIFVCNTILKADIPKYKLRDGNFDKETFALFRKAADWLESKKENQNITIIPLQKYKVDDVIKVIKKYSSLGCNYFMLDTFKVSTDVKTEQIWQAMMRDSVMIYDTIKPSVKNVHMWITYQLDKASSKQRYYGNSNIGMSKNVVDVCSTNLMVRKPFDDEFIGGKRELTCYRLEGKSGKTRIPFKLDRNKHYMIVFITKNRFGATGEYQIVAECDLSKNKYAEIGVVNIDPDF
jgi:replicative DNA helicase